MIRHLGYACINLTLSKNYSTNKTIRLSNFSLDKASNIALSNIISLKKILEWNINNNIYFFRISSDIFPLIDHKDVKYSINDLKDKDQILENIKYIGELAKQNSVKLEMHPGPYTVLASDNQNVVDNSILSIESHSNFADLLGYGKELKINIHIGTAKGGLEDSAKRFCNNFKLLSDSAKSRLTVENDDKGSMFDILSLDKYIYQSIGIPLCFDFHHWNFCKGDCQSQFDGFLVSLKTWGDEIPTVHWSESSVGLKRNHSDYIAGPIPEYDDFTYDVMIEAKAKELALLRYRNLIGV